MARFDQETLRKLHGCKEVAIRTTKHPGSAVTIWVVVSSTDVFVRSVRGTKGRWYRDLANWRACHVGVQRRAVSSPGRSCYRRRFNRTCQPGVPLEISVEPLCRIDCAPRGVGNYAATGPSQVAL